MKNLMTQMEILEPYRGTANENQQPPPHPTPNKFARLLNNRQVQQNPQDELAKYIQFAKLFPPEQIDILDFWRVQGTVSIGRYKLGLNLQVFPKLKRLAQLILCVYAANVECERTFSIHKWIKVDPRRSSLSQSQTSAIMMNRTPLADRTNRNGEIP